MTRVDELRAEARACLDAAKRATAPEIWQWLASQAVALAQMAEQMEIAIATGRNIDRYRCVFVADDLVEHLRSTRMWLTIGAPHPRAKH